jgi:hypothetical protein
LSASRDRSKIEIPLFVHKLTKAALLVSELGRIGPDGNVLSGTFLPLSEIEFPDGEEARLERWDASGGPLFAATPVLQLNLLVPEWLAAREGLI